LLELEENLPLLLWTASRPRWVYGSTFRSTGLLPGICTVSGIVADAAVEIAAGVEDVLQKLILGIATIDDIEAIGVQGRPQLFGFVAIAGRHGYRRHGFSTVMSQSGQSKSTMLQRDKPGTQLFIVSINK
jgi:hypothetical protein